MEIELMSSKKIIVALVLLLSATSASLAQGRHHRTYYDYAPGYGASTGMNGGAVGGGESGDMGIGSQR
jgi:hypothetical protein